MCAITRCRTRASTYVAESAQAALAPRDVDTVVRIIMIQPSRNLKHRVGLSLSGAVAGHSYTRAPGLRAQAGADRFTDAVMGCISIEEP